MCTVLMLNKDLHSARIKDAERLTGDEFVVSSATLFKNLTEEETRQIYTSVRDNPLPNHHFAIHYDDHADDAKLLRRMFLLRRPREEEEPRTLLLLAGSLLGLVIVKIMLVLSFGESSPEDS
jgi:hypothetical protein